MGILDFLFPKFPRRTFGSIASRNLNTAAESKVKDSWAKIEEHLKVGKPSNLKQGVIESDKIVDFVLMNLTVGQTMGERLKAARPLFDRDSYNALWEAHKVRNSLVHESNYDPPYYICKEAIAKYKAALLALNIRL